ncbi:MAG TPA: DUF1326 domain-containing protein [Chloroflexota bacterium]|nr:DUF1326 domain-containing protein [Chloroflexota bacterium]
MASWVLKGECLKGCNSPAICACDVGCTAPLQGFCASVLAMQIQVGHYDAVDLSGLRWVMAARWPGPLFGGNGTMDLFIDEGASAEQRACLARVLNGEEGGAFFEIMSAVVTTRSNPVFAPIHFALDRDRRRARVSVPDRLDLRVEPLTAELTGEEQRVIVRVPGGLAFREMEAARTRCLRANGAVALDCRATHAALAWVEFSNETLIS